MEKTKPTSFFRELAVAILPLFFSVYLFAGFLEAYKNEISSRKDLVVDFYRPMREAQTDCRAAHNRLFIKYGELAGTYKLLVDEVDHLAAADLRSLNRNYEALPKSIIETNNKVSAEVNDLKTKVDACSSALYRKYEELALATSMHDQFLEVENKHNAAVNAIYAKRKTMAESLAGKTDLESLMDTLRQALGSDLDSAEMKKVVVSKMHETGGPLVAFYTNLGENEQDVFKANMETDVQLNSLFAKEISRRYKRGLLSAMLPW
ncbi:hypothetical protein ACI2UK_13565 [Ralstonia nicotianae]|uniref:hypothetical protein n=1 Tax=Ralstonia pseudosolanacearum TaxID=1310165 RepID=UPI0020054487|nr:hypothetical protein [Ralstonia pseudosolanacearum]MCK4118427.1 hypothetical protein [Ralstonia pseudosolanacearum]